MLPAQLSPAVHFEKFSIRKPSHDMQIKPWPTTGFCRLFKNFIWRLKRSWQYSCNSICPPIMAWVEKIQNGSHLSSVSNINKERVINKQLRIQKKKSGIAAHSGSLASSTNGMQGWSPAVWMGDCWLWQEELWPEGQELWLMLNVTAPKMHI